MNKGKLLGIDHGTKRIGIAVCDSLRLSARELLVINRKSKSDDFSVINAIAQKEGAVGIVVGFPVNFDAPPDKRTQADTVRLWADRLSHTTELPIILWNEQFSSEDAKVLARQKRRKPSDPIDDLAARVILQSYIDSLHNGLAVDIVSPPEHDD
jgi:putative Holliday junction resolvase